MKILNKLEVLRNFLGFLLSLLIASQCWILWSHSQRSLIIVAYAKNESFKQKNYFHNQELKKNLKCAIKK